MLEKKELKQIIDDLIEVAKVVISENSDMDSIMNTKSPISLETIFSEACSYQRGMMANRNKDKQREYNQSGSPSEVIPPTENQLSFLKKSDYKGEMPKTNMEAYLIIKKIKESWKT